MKFNVKPYDNIIQYASIKRNREHTGVSIGILYKIKRDIFALPTIIRA